MFHLKVYMSVTCFNKYTQMGWQRQKPGLYTPCWEHTVDWAHNWERKQISWPGPVCAGSGWGEHIEIENKRPFQIMASYFPG